MQTIEFLQRDRGMIEVRYFLPITPQKSTHSQSQFDIFTFIPASFGTSPLTTGSHDMGKRFQSLYRLHFPKMKLASFFESAHPDNPLTRLRAVIDSLPGGITNENLSQLESLIRFCGAELIEALNREPTRIIEHLSDDDEVTKGVDRLRSFFEHTVMGAELFRQWQLKAEGYQSLLPTGVPDSLRMAGEYFAVTASDQLAVMMQTEQIRCLPRDVRQALQKEAETAALSLMATYELIPLDELREEDKEYLAYRTNRLKKELQRCLYLEPEDNKRLEFVSNSAAMVAAGLAALWATMAQVPLLSGKFGETTSALFFSVAIGAYILKDRIKELIRRQLSKKWSPWDRLYRFNIEHLKPFGVGSYRGRVEHTSRWTDGDTLDAIIRDARTKDRSVGEIDAEIEHVVHHHQRLAIECSEARSIDEECGVQQVLRFSLKKLLDGLDEPQREIHTFHPGTRRFTSASLPRVYHLNFVAKLTTSEHDEPIIARCRAVVNSKGVVRLESKQFASDERFDSALVDRTTLTATPAR